MVHRERRYCVVGVDSVEELAGRLTEHTWCGCNGFRLGDLLFLNDSFSPDGAQEFGVVRDGVQFESITFSWCSRTEAERYIRECLATTPADYPMRVPVGNQIEAPEEHGRCGHCA